MKTRNLNIKKPKIAFVCNHNSCRSQISEAISKLKSKEVFDSYSAGTEIKNNINKDAVRLIKKIYNIDMEKTQKPKTLDEIPEPDIIIFMGCDVSCPIADAKYTENWNLDDPTGKSDSEFSKIISIIEKNIVALTQKISKGEITL